MSKSRGRRHFMEETYGKIRKPMPKPGKVMRNDKDEDVDKKWNFRDWEDEEKEEKEEKEE